MTYRETCQYLDTLYDPRATTLPVPAHEFFIHRCDFTSASWTSLPGALTYVCGEHGIVFHEQLEPKIPRRSPAYPDILTHGDIDIAENKKFTYLIFKKAAPARAEGVILFFHGLNEHRWNKYLPWAAELLRLTGKAVLLFPIAFHMNRAPAAWGSARPMNAVSDIRRRHSPAINNSSFANAAISARIEQIPQRYFWSGLQTFDDVVRLVTEIRDGSHPLIAPNAGVDIFSYSVGSFLGQILLMADPHGYFQRSKLFMFCGGPTLDRMSPNSKFILDSDATIALHSFFSERLETELVLDKRIAHYFGEGHPAGVAFRLMLTYQKNKEKRERLFRQLQKQLYAVALRKDDVIPAAEVLNTLKGEYRDIGTHVDVLDFPFPYTHINPFPTTGAQGHLVDESFNEVFTKAAAHFRRDREANSD